MVKYKASKEHMITEYLGEIVDWGLDVQGGRVSRGGAFARNPLFAAD